MWHYKDTIEIHDVSGCEQDVIANGRGYRMPMYGFESAGIAIGCPLSTLETGFESVSRPTTVSMSSTYPLPCHLKSSTCFFG